MINLSATICDITAAGTSDPKYDQYPGKITNAKVQFLVQDTQNTNQYNPISGCNDLPVGLVDSSDLQTGTTSCTWTPDIGNSDSQSYTILIVIVVKGYYDSGPGTANAQVVTVSKPTPGLITGGSYVVNAKDSRGLPSGQLAPKLSERSFFGFNAKKLKSGALQGRINTIVRSDNGKIYQIKGNSMTSLTTKVVASPTQSTSSTAIFEGKANIQHITSPAAPVSVNDSGNSQLRVTITDSGEPGTYDKIGITLWNSAGGVWFSTYWDGTKTQAGREAVT